MEYFQINFEKEVEKCCENNNIAVKQEEPWIEDDSSQSKHVLTDYSEIKPEELIIKDEENRMLKKSVQKQNSNDPKYPCGKWKLNVGNQTQGILWSGESAHWFHGKCTELCTQEFRDLHATMEGDPSYLCEEDKYETENGKGEDLVGINSASTTLLNGINLFNTDFGDDYGVQQAVTQDYLVKSCFVLIERCDEQSSVRKNCEPMIKSYGLRQYNQTQSTEKTYKCNCCKQFSQLSKLKQHVQNHHLIKHFKCKTCHTSFKCISSLQNHVQSNNCVKMHKCYDCGKTFIRLTHLKRHIRSHIGDKSYECIKCNKFFVDKNGLRVHMRKHTGAKPFECHDCGKCFSCLVNLSRHIRIHTGEKPYECEYCFALFRYSTDLRRHKRVHTGLKPFKCKECGKTFSRSNTLTRHSLIHTGEKPFECNFCCKSFTRNYMLLDHIKIHRQ